MFRFTDDICINGCSCLWEKEAPTEDANAQKEASSEAVQDYHIGIVTTSVSQSEDNFRGAEAVAKKIWFK